MTLLQRIPGLNGGSRRLVGVSLSLLLASSCALPSSRPSAITGPEASAVTFADHTTPSETKASAVAQSPVELTSQPIIQQLSHEVPATDASAVGDSDKLREWPALPPGQPLHPFASPTVPAQYLVPDPALCERYPTEPRIDLPTKSLSLQNCPMPWEQCTEVPVPVCEPEVWADEYLCDGGDRGNPVHYHGVEMAGLDTEDTVVEFTDETGKRRVKPSSRACVYAPQFASVRSATLSEVGLKVDRAAGAHDDRSTAGLKSRRAADEKLHNDQPIGLNVRSRVSGLDTDAATTSLEQIAAAVNHVKLQNLFEDRMFFQRVQLNQTQEAYLAYGLQAAVAWTRDLNPVIVASDIGGQELIAHFKAEEYVGIEDKRTPGDLKIVKLADKHSAHPGDIVSFTIHYDNVGQRELSEVRIIDNLTPRLEYIEDSADSDRDGKLVVEDNGEGSLVLTFELTEPLPGESGGTVTFKTRVR